MENTTQYVQIESTGNQVKRLQSDVNKLWKEYLQEPNLSRSTKLLKKWSEKLDALLAVEQRYMVQIKSFIIS